MRRRKNGIARIAAGAMIALAGGAIAMLLVPSCERSQGRKAIVLNPTTRVSPPASTRAAQATIAAATRPAGENPATQAAAKLQSYMRIKNVIVPFPEAKLTLRREGDKVSAFLVSNDPPDVIQPSYQGNRFYFEMTLDTIDDVKNIGSADFRYKASSASAEDKPETQNGIFLDGDRQHLQPYDILVTFDQDGDHVVANIQGQFIHYPKGSVLGEFVPVSATLAAKPEKGEKK
jgi:hypothetical protein